jgi:uncharacterized membrane protein YdcZ (DUF606 family)
MPKELKDVENIVMEKIHQGKIKMKPKMYFVLGSILTFVGLVSTVIISTFMVGLIKFSFRANNGWRAQYKLEQMLSDFPWWIVIIAIAGLVLGIWIIKKYNFAHKIKPWILIVGFILAILIAGLITDKTGVNDALIIKHQPMRKMMKLEPPQNNNFHRNIPKQK